MVIIFDGRTFADKVSESIGIKVRGLKLVSIFDPDNPGSVAYTKIKEKKAGELGVDFEKIQKTNDKVLVKNKIHSLNTDENVDGLLLQMTLGFGDEDMEIAGIISPKKDVDGLNPYSGVMPATVRAVTEILNSINEAPDSRQKLCVLGNLGMVGRRMQEELENTGKYDVKGMDKEDFDPEKIREADIVISATGQAGLIKPEMVKAGVIAIDVGFPVGDFDPAIAQKAAFFTPVPGGVGPVTVAMLFANLAELISKRIKN